jgi:hypothetical protein
MLPGLVSLLRRPTCSQVCVLAGLRPVGAALPPARFFAAGPAPKQKSSKMRKKLRTGTLLFQNS